VWLRGRGSTEPTSSPSGRSDGNRRSSSSFARRGRVVLNGRLVGIEDRARAAQQPWGEVCEADEGVRGLPLERPAERLRLARQLSERRGLGIADRSGSPTAGRWRRQRGCNRQQPEQRNAADRRQRCGQAMIQRACNERSFGSGSTIPQPARWRNSLWRATLAYNGAICSE